MTLHGCVNSPSEEHSRLTQECGLASMWKSLTFMLEGVQHSNPFASLAESKSAVIVVIIIMSTSYPLFFFLHSFIYLPSFLLFLFNSFVIIITIQVSFSLSLSPSPSLCFIFFVHLLMHCVIYFSFYIPSASLPISCITLYVVSSLPTRFFKKLYFSFLWIFCSFLVLVLSWFLLAVARRSLRSYHIFGLVTRTCSFIIWTISL